jgi:NAD(P)-dependent dehydrogenase (short-subunit alcohol dehydrogenase family)
VAIQGKVVVITGASSGIGRATAYRFAKAGARLVVAARRTKPLDVAVHECAKLGGQATAVQVDVTDPDSVANLARRAVESYGRIDIWVNNAAVALYARVDEGPLEAHRRVIETNLLGYLYGSRIAVRIFRQQGRGVLVNVCSATAYVGQPYSSAYVASKFGIRGLSESIRQEVSDCPEIRVCTVMPGATDTPFFQHAGNYMGRAVQPLRPIADARRVASAIVATAERPIRTTFVDIARVLPLLKAIAPGWIEAYVGNLVRKGQFRDEPAPASPGNLFEPMAEGDDVSGGWRLNDQS